MRSCARSVCRLKSAAHQRSIKTRSSFAKMVASPCRRNVSNFAHILHLQRSDLSVKPAEEDDFFKYTTKRWLFNESYELSRRYVHFNVQGLFETAVKVVGNGATQCVHAMKFREGQYNKVFLLVLDNGTEVVAKIPNPNAGPPYYTTASEVATMDFLRTILRFPIPKVLGWSSGTANPVGTEYIIMEKARGILLGERWYHLERTAKNDIIQQVVELENSLAARSFPAHGCLFYEEDVPLQLRCKLKVSGDTLQKYTIGPVVDPALWEDGRESLDVHRGPWLSLTSYSTDLGKNEKEWVMKNAEPRMNYFRNDDKPELPNEMLDLINKYLVVTPWSSRSAGVAEDLHTSVLWHPDLHLNNVFIDPETNAITDIIDWQCSQVAPLVLQGRIPRMFRHIEPLQPGLILPERASGYESLDSEAKHAADRLHESALCQKYYEVLTAKNNPSHYAAILHRHERKAPFLEPLELICGSWKNREIYKLRSALIRITESWDGLETGLAECPIAFTEEQVKHHDEELENIDYIESIMEAFQDEGILPADGRVDPEDFEDLTQLNQVQKERYLSLAKDEHERFIMEKTWPWQDWPERGGNPQILTF